MAKRRANNEGTIYQKANGKWRAQICMDGQRMSFTGKTQGECSNWLKNIRRDIDNGLTYKGGEKTLDELISEWMVVVQATKARGTLVQYRYTIRKRITPFLGKMKLKHLKPERIQRYMAELLEKGNSNHAVHHTHKVLRAALSHAVRIGYLGKNPCSSTTPPKPKQTEMQFYDEGQVKTLLSTAQEIGDRFFPLYYLAVHTGMRLSELIGLKWEDIDPGQRTLQVKRQVQHYKGGGFVFTRPKTKSAIRTIILGQNMLDALEDHRQYQRELIDRAGDTWTDYNLVFASGVGTPVTGSNIRREFRKLLKASGLPKIRFHDLRHTAASLMLNHGVPVLIASKRLGHSKPSITLDVYGHLMAVKQEEAADLLDRLVFVE